MVTNNISIASDVTHNSQVTNSHKTNKSAFIRWGKVVQQIRLLERMTTDIRNDDVPFCELGNRQDLSSPQWMYVSQPS